MNKKAVIYARVSSANDRQSNARQINDLQKLAAAFGYDISAIFEEKISGAVKNEERPILLTAIDYCVTKGADNLIVSELSRLGRNALEVLAVIKKMVDIRVNLILQKENFKLFSDNGEIATFAPIMLAVLSTCAELERENIRFRLQSGLRRYKDLGGKVGRKKGSVKTLEQKRLEYKGVIKRLKNGEKLRDIAKLEGVGVSTVQRIKAEFGL